MSRIQKFIIVSAFSLFLAIPNTSHAATVSDIQGNINQLLSAISQLQALINKPPAGHMGVSPTCVVYASKANAAVNEPFTVTWYAANADYVKDGGGKDSVTGSLPVTSNVPGIYTYSLTAVNANGTATCSTSVAIQAATTTPQAVVTNGNVSAQLITDRQDPSQDFGTYILRFNVMAVGGDLYFPVVASTSAAAGVSTVYAVTGNPPFTGLMAASLSTPAAYYNSNFYIVRAGETKMFTFAATLNPSATGNYAVKVTKVMYNTTPNAPNASTNISLKTDSLHIPDSATTTATTTAFASDSNANLASAMTAAQSAMSALESSIHGFLGH